MKKRVIQTSIVGIVCLVAGMMVHKYLSERSDCTATGNSDFLVLQNRSFNPEAILYVSPEGNDRAEGTAVAPLQSVEEAIKRAREWRRLKKPGIERGIGIRLSDGVYPLIKPLFVRPEDSGTPESPTIISAAPNAQPVISGGIRVTGWKRGCTDNRFPAEIRQKLWTAPAPLVGNRIVETRQLWVDGERAVRATSSNGGSMERLIDFNPGNETITIPTPPNIKALQESRQAEMLVHQRWATAILRIKEMKAEGGKTIVSFHQPESHLEFAHPWPQPVINGERGSSSFCLMNSPTLLDEPGEWYQDYPSGTLYYLPHEDTDMTKAEITIPVLDRLLTISGTAERRVKHFHFEGVTFAHSAWLTPSVQGHVTLQGGFAMIDAYKLHEPGLPEKATLENQAWIVRPQTAIGAEYCTDVNFTGCTFKHLSATGLDYIRAAHYCKVAQNTFTDIGGTALQIGIFPDQGFETHIPYTPLHPEVLCSHITINDNLITHATVEDWGCVGIGAGYVSNTNILHNEVCHLNYSGICVGWGWTPLESGMKENRIENNYVHHFAAQLYDAGGIYTLSNQPGSTIRGNRIEELIDAPYATNERAFYIYFDEATDGYTVEENWCPEVHFGYNQPGEAMVIRNNGSEVDENIKKSAGRRIKD